MNTVQRTILVLGALALLAAVLFPPWVISESMRLSGASAGYHFIMRDSEGGMRVNTTLLFVEVAAISIATYFIFTATRKS